MESGDDDRPNSEPVDDGPSTTTTAATTDLISAENATELRRQAKQLRRARLLSTIAAILRSSRTPLHEIIRDHVLPHLPPTSIHRFRTVSASWNRSLSSPLFAHSQSLSHRSISGVFSPFNTPSFLPFDPRSHSLPDPSLSFLPDPLIAVRSASNGLLCCQSPSSHYLILNPCTKEWTPLPKPSTRHADLVLVFQPAVYNFRSDYFLVCAFEVGSESGVYGFEVFSSESGEWRTSGELCSADGLIDGSGVSAGGAACWRTTIQTVVRYDPAADVVRVLTWPAAELDEARWELAEIDGVLSCVSATASDLTVYSLVGSTDWWAPRGTFLVAGEKGWRWARKWGKEDGGVLFWQRPWPLRSQSRDLEVVVWTEGRVIVLDLAGRRVRDQCSCDLMAVTFFSHVNTLAPVHHQFTASYSEPPVPKITQNRAMTEM